MKSISGLSLAFVLAARVASAAEPVDTELPKYDVSWTSPSASIIDSMPIGNGHTAALVWAESNKDLMVSIATGDSWDENARSIRLGNLRLAFTPSPFGQGKPFAQVLKYRTGEITLSVGTGPSIQVRIWVDAHHPVVHVEASGDSAFGLQVTPELWRTQTQDISNNTPWKDFIHVAKDVSSNTSLLKVVLKPDVSFTTTSGVGWYHRNETSHWGETMSNQGFDVAKYGIKDPLTNRTMGALIRGSGLAPSGNKLASTEPQKQFRVDIATHTELATDVASWQTALETESADVFAKDIETLRSAHQRYWSELWDRSYIFVTGDTDAENATKGWLAARYLMACQGRAEGAIEFNGGLFTFQNDTKLWHDYTQANQQFAHWSLLPSGDFDLIQPWFKMLVASLPVGRARAQAMWKHAGAMFAEHMIIYGPQSGSHYGWDRTGRDPSYELVVSTRLLYGGVIENAVMMLDHYEYTDDSVFATEKLVPFASEILTWYDLHWKRQGGKLYMSPIFSGEKDKDVTNSMVDVAGLTKLVSGMLALPEALTTTTQREQWTRLKGELPPLPIANNRFAPAADLAVGGDTNNQNLAPIFPYRLYGPTKPDLQVAVDSYNSRTGQAPRDGTEAWRHDAAHAAYLGLATEAKSQAVSRFTRYKYRYQGFLNGAPDGDHCIEPGAIGKIALQAMLLHPGKDQTLNVLNAWPNGWNARFKLWGPHKTWVAGQVTGNQLTSLTVGPKARVGDVLVKGAAPSGITISGSDEPGGFIAGGTVVTPMDPPVGGSAGSSAGGTTSSNNGGFPSGGAGAPPSPGAAGSSSIGGAPGSSSGGGVTAGSSPAPSGASNGGCSCAVIGAQPAPWAWSVLGLCGALLRLRRRRAVLTSPRRYGA